MCYRYLENEGMEINLFIHQKSGDPSLSPTCEVTSTVPLVRSHFLWTLCFFVVK